MDALKRKWIKRAGITRMTDEVIHELTTYDEAQGMTSERLKKSFQYYRRYGQMIIPYSTWYLEQTPLERLKAVHRHNIRTHIISHIIYQTKIGNYLYRFCKSSVGHYLTSPYTLLGAAIGATIPIIVLWDK